MKQSIYISGKITGLPESEYKSRFKLAQQTYEQLGYEVINPNELDHSLNNTWVDYMMTCIAALMHVDSIYMLNNWRSSKGARIEHSIAIEMGKHNKTIPARKIIVICMFFLQKVLF